MNRFSYSQEVIEICFHVHSQYNDYEDKRGRMKLSLLYVL